MLVLIGRMKLKLIPFSCSVLFALTLACTGSAADTKRLDEQNIRDHDAQWSKAAGAKDLEKCIGNYSDDAIVLPANAAAATGKEAIRSVWKELLASPGLAMSWTTTKVEVSKSGDMAYSSGNYELSMTDPTGKPINDRGKYLEVWKKQPEGKWKCSVDIWNSDLPATPAASPSPTEKQ